MSDRIRLVDAPAKNASSHRKIGVPSVEVYMDGESGTYRVFLNPSLECVDFTLAQFRDFAAQVAIAVVKIDTHPDRFDAEQRHRWIHAQ